MRTNGKKLKLGIIGAGAIAQAYARACEKCENVSIVAVADIRPEAATALAEGFGCQSFGSVEALTQRAKPDAAIVCTPPSTHLDVCLHLIERGIHVLCEKPLTLDVRGATHMVEAARKAGVTLTMGSKFRYVDDVIRAKSIVTSGILGDIVLFENVFTSQVDMTLRWNSEPSISGGGVLIDNGSHSVDIVRYFLGPLAELQVVEGRRVQSLQVEDTVRILVRSVSGVMGSIDLSWSINKEQPNYISIYGSRGTVFIGWKESKYRQSSSRDWIVFGHGYDKVQAFRSQVVNFANALLYGETLLINAQDALASVQAVEAAYVALRQSRWTRVRPFWRASVQPKTNGHDRVAVAVAP